MAQKKQEKTKFDPSNLIRGERFNNRDTFLKENPAYESTKFGFYIQSYEHKIDEAVKDYAESVMDKKPKRILSAGRFIYSGEINGRDAYISRDAAKDHQYISITFMEPYNLQEKQEHKPTNFMDIKNEGSQLWGQLQSLPRHNQEPATKNILTKDDVVKRFNENILNRETPHLEMRNINSKEKIMSDERQDVSSQVDEYLNGLKGNVLPGNTEEREISPQLKTFIDATKNAAYQRKVVADAIKAGTLSCLPGKDGYADTTPAVNIMTPEKPYHGENLLFLKAFQKQKQNGFPTAEYVTYHQIDKAREEGLNVYVREGQKGVSLLIDEQNKETGERTNKNIRLFNVAQLNNPAQFKKWAEKEIEKQAQEELAYKQTQYGTGYTPPEKHKEKGPDEIVCSSTEPEKYLGQYLAAVSMGSKFKVSPEQAAEFSEKMVSALYAPMEPRVNKETGEIKLPPINKETGQPVTDAFSLEKISINANKECREFMRDLRMAAQKQEQPEQKLEQQQSRGGRGM